MGRTESEPGLTRPPLPKADFRKPLSRSCNGRSLGSSGRDKAAEAVCVAGVDSSVKGDAAVRRAVLFSVACCGNGRPADRAIRLAGRGAVLYWRSSAPGDSSSGMPIVTVGLENKGRVPSLRDAREPYLCDRGSGLLVTGLPGRLAFSFSSEDKPKSLRVNSSNWAASDFGCVDFGYIPRPAVGGCP